jgi:hypothetical protein
MTANTSPTTSDIAVTALEALAAAKGLPTARAADWWAEVIFRAFRRTNAVPEAIREDALAARVSFTERAQTPASQAIHQAWVDAERDCQASSARSARITRITRAVEHMPPVRAWAARLTNVAEANLTSNDVKDAVTIQVAAFDVTLDNAASDLWHTIIVTCFPEEQQPAPSDR